MEKPKKTALEHASELYERGRQTGSPGLYRSALRMLEAVPEGRDMEYAGKLREAILQKLKL